MRYITLLACLLLTGCLQTCKHSPPSGGVGVYSSTPTNTTFTVTPPLDGSAPTTQSFEQTHTATNLVSPGPIVDKVTTNFNSNGLPSSVIHETSVPAPPVTNTITSGTSVGAVFAAPKVDTAEGLKASYEAMKPLQYVGIGLIVVGILGGAVVAFVLKWPTLGLKLGGVTAATGAALLVFYKVLATVSPTVLFLTCLLVVLGIAALVLDHFHIFKSGKLDTHAEIAEQTAK